jgi:uncharacterized protein (TIGR00369 family)
VSPGAAAAASAVTVEEVNAFLAAELPFFGAMGIRCDAVARGVAVTRFSYDERWARPGGIVNGVTMMGLADLATYVAIFTMAGIVPMAVTNELKMNFLRPAVGRDVLARATLHKLGRRVAFASVALFEVGDDDRLVAHATASYVLPDDPAEPSPGAP